MSETPVRKLNSIKNLVTYLFCMFIVKNIIFKKKNIRRLKKFMCF